jgi:hypothetical protein
MLARCGFFVSPRKLAPAKIALLDSQVAEIDVPLSPDQTLRFVLWIEATPGETFAVELVTISVAGMFKRTSFTATADERGRWTTTYELPSSELSPPDEVESVVLVGGSERTRATVRIRSTQKH